MMRRRWFFAFALSAAVAPSALACFVSIDESRIGGDASSSFDATTSDGPASFDAPPGVSADADADAAAEAMAPLCDAASPPVIELEGVSTAHDVYLTFTPGPMYSLSRHDKMAVDGTYPIIAMIPACVGVFHDYGQAQGLGVQDSGIGLKSNYDFYYEFTVFIPEAGVDPNYPAPLPINVQTRQDDDAGTAHDNVTELCAAGADVCADAGELGPAQ